MIKRKSGLEEGSVSIIFGGEVVTMNESVKLLEGEYDLRTG